MVDVGKALGGLAQEVVAILDIGDGHFAVHIKDVVLAVNFPWAEIATIGEAMSQVHAEPCFAYAALGEDKAQITLACPGFDQDSSWHKMQQMELGGGDRGLFEGSCPFLILIWGVLSWVLGVDVHRIGLLISGGAKRLKCLRCLGRRLLCRADH